MLDLSSYVQSLEEFFSSKYMKELQKLAEFYPEQKSLIVDYMDLDMFDPELADEFLDNPDIILEACREAVSNLNILNSEGKKIVPHIRFVNLPVERNLLVRHISSEYINKMISVEGVVTKTTTVRPKIVEAVYQCRRCGQVYTIEQSQKREEPPVCECGRKDFALIEDKSKFIDFQKAQLQEPLELLKGGSQAATIDLLIEDDLTGYMNPGEKVQIVGIVRLRPPKGRSAVYDKVIEVNSITKIEKEFEELDITPEEEEEIKKLAKDPHIYEKIVRSIAPEIYGYEEIKEAIALQLFGGTPGKRLPTGTKMRHNFHILLIGDPGAAKTRLLQYVKNLAPKAIYVSGKSVTGGGLTAVAEKDEFAEGGWTLKAGALVLAAGGIALIDEFDKMTDHDKSAMHEAMESGTISIAKAGIVTQFKADASILAAANPKYGRFDPNEIPAKQFNIPVTILSRFDLIFPMIDYLDESRDASIAEHILKAHRIAATWSQSQEDTSDISPVIPHDLLRKYIAYARKNIRPVLTVEASERIKEFYTEMRAMGQTTGVVPITPRYLEGLVRLAEASAKLRLSETVDIEDAERAIRLMKYYLRTVGMDPNTKQIDIDIITTGRPKSRVDKIKRLLNLIKSLNQEYDEVTHEMLLEEAKKDGISPEELDEFLQELLRNGDIYKPRKGVYKPSEE